MAQVAPKAQRDPSRWLKKRENAKKNGERAQLSPGAIWVAQLSPGAIWVAQLSPGATWVAQLSPGATWVAQLSPGATWVAQLSPGATWVAQLSPQFFGLVAIIFVVQLLPPPFAAAKIRKYKKRLKTGGYLPKMIQYPKGL